MLNILFGIHIKIFVVNIISHCKTFLVFAEITLNLTTKKSCIFPLKMNHLYEGFWNVFSLLSYQYCIACPISMYIIMPFLLFTRKRKYKVLHSPIVYLCTRNYKSRIKMYLVLKNYINWWYFFFILHKCNCFSSLCISIFFNIYKMHYSLVKIIIFHLLFSILI